jgi:ERCC4-related helicase
MAKKADPVYTAEDKDRMRTEIKSLREFKELATFIVKNSKGEVLLTALKKGFVKARDLGAPQKVIIFTESTRRQEYLRQVLEQTHFGKIVRFNGTNRDVKSKEICAAWLERHKGTDRVTGSPRARSLEGEFSVSQLAETNPSNWRVRQSDASTVESSLESEEE